jgi:tape measure domain-containing protein
MEKIIASLVGRLKFDVDVSGLLKFEKMLDVVNAKMLQTEKRTNTLRRKLNALAPASQSTLNTQLKANQKLTREAFTEQLRQSKLTFSQDKAALQLAQERVKLSKLEAIHGQHHAKHLAGQQKANALAHKSDIQAQKLKQQSQLFNLRSEQQRLRVQQEASRLQATQSRTLAAADRAKITAMRLEERLARRLQNTSNTSKASRKTNPWMNSRHPQTFSRGGLISGVGHVAGAGLGGAVGASIPGLGMFSAGLHPAAMGLAAVAAAAVAAQRKLKEFAEQDIKASDTRAIERAQLRVFTKGNRAEAKAAESGLTEFANKIGVQREALAKPYVMANVNLADAGIERKDSTALVQGIMSFARGTGTNEDDMAGALRAIQQMVSKGQLMAEEWKGQFAERIAGADKLGVETFAQITKSGLTGDKAKADFSTNMKDGKIKGELLNKFLIALGEKMASQANLEGRLDTIAASAESSQNRIENMRGERSIRTAEFDNGALKSASVELFQAKERLEKSLEQLVPWFSKLETSTINLETRFTDTTTSFVGWLARMGESVEGFTKDERVLTFLNAMNEAFDYMADALAPLISLLGDVSTFMASVVAEAIQELFSSLTEGWNAIKPWLGIFPEFGEQIVAGLRSIIGKFFDLVGLGDKWRTHVAKREAARAQDNPEKPSQTDSKVSGSTQPSPLSKIEQMAKQAANSPAFQDNIDRIASSTPTTESIINNHNNTNNVNTNNVFTVNIDVDASGATNPDAVAAAVESKMRDVARDVFSNSLEATKTSLISPRI